MKSNDIDQLLNGLLETPGFRTRKPAPAPQPPEEPKKPAASEASRRRVDEILRSVELETIQKQAEEPPQRPATPPPPPRREPIPPPEPVSHFSDEPSLSPAVRMHERLDEESLPMLDAERKPNQIIEPKPRPVADRPRKKRRRPPVDQERTKTFHVNEKPESVPEMRPKRKVMHINVPDELPPDPDLMDAEPAPVPAEKPKRKVMHINVPDELPPDPDLMDAESAPVPAEKPKRKVMHINVPDELPPDPDLMDAEPAPVPRPKRKRKPRPKRPVETPAPEESVLPELPAAEEETLPEPPAEEVLPPIPDVPPVGEVMLPDDLNDLDLTPPVSFEELLGMEPDFPDLDDSDMPEIPEIPEEPEEFTTPAEPEEESAPTPKRKRKIMHINVPDELPPDIPRDTSIADAIRKKREAAQPAPEETYEEPLAAESEEPAYEEADIPADDGYEEVEEVYDDAYEEDPVPEEEAEEVPAPRPSRLRHLSVPTEEPKQDKSGLFGLFSRKKKV